MGIINYAKYENMNRKQLSKHLKKAKKKYKKLNKKFNKKLKKSNELIEFLMIKIIKARSNKKHKFITWEESKSFKIFRGENPDFEKATDGSTITLAETDMGKTITIYVVVGGAA